MQCLLCIWRAAKGRFCRNFEIGILDILSSVPAGSAVARLVCTPVCAAPVVSLARNPLRNKARCFWLLNSDFLSRAWIAFQGLKPGNGFSPLFLIIVKKIPFHRLEAGVFNKLPGFFLRRGAMAFQDIFLDDNGGYVIRA